MSKNKIVSEHQGGMLFSTSIDGHIVNIDLKPEHGGTDTASGPKILMLVSLAGCTGVDVVAILNKMKVMFTDFKVEVEAKLSEETPKVYTDVNIKYIIKVDEEKKGNVEKAVKLSQEKYCGVSRMFQSFANLTSEILYVD